MRLRRYVKPSLLRRIYRLYLVIFSVTGNTAT